jgi:hypothetical protein
MPTKLDDGQRVTLKRSLRHRDLILYGIILIQPTAPMISTIWSSKAAMNFVPEIPYVAWVFFSRLCSRRSIFAASKLRRVSTLRLRRGWES